MSLTPEDRSAVDERKERQRPSRAGVPWATILGFVLSIGALAKAAPAIGDMRSDEKGVVWFLLALGTLLTGVSLAVNLEQRNGTNLTSNVLSVLLRMVAVFVTVRAW